jgi:MFS family permease
MSLDPPSESLAGKGRSLAVLAACEVLGMSLWFSASAVLPALKTQYPMSGAQAAALSSSIALGFVAGTLLSAVLGLADRFEPRRFFALSALAGAAANGATVLLEPTGLAFVALRFAVGASIAGIYPVGIKMAATWARADLGLLVGLLVAASTLGNASAFLLAAFGDVDWRSALLGASALAVLAAALIALFEAGPRHRQTVTFRARYVLDAWRVRPLRLANLGYYGHMWELYAMWAWIAAFAEASFLLSTPALDAPFAAKLAAFATIGLGAIGCLAGGILADRWGRTALTIAAMLVSGSCAVLAGFVFGSPPWLLVVFCIVWGIAAIADSAQFSASVVELSDAEHVGTMVTVQTCVGFLLTMVSIHLVPPINLALGWQWTFLFLAIGPFLGAYAMYALRRDPVSVKLAGGRR